MQALSRSFVVRPLARLSHPLVLARAVLARCALTLRGGNRDPFLLVALLCAWFACRGLLYPVGAQLGTYDETLLFLDAQLMRDGHAIYRDFYSNYPPGIFQLIRGVTALGLPEIWAMRGLTFLVHIASAVLSGRLVVVARGAFGAVHLPRICWTATACVLCLQAGLGCAPYAYCYAVLLLQVALLAWPHPGARPWRFWLCGLLFGVLSYLRHDVAVYVFAALGAVEALAWVVGRRSAVFGSLREALHLLGTAAVTAVVLWAPIFARAGFGRVLHDLVLDVSKITMPARVLPIPPLWNKLEVSALNLELPAFLSGGAEVCLVLSGIALFSGALFAARAFLSEGPLTRERRLVLILIACALASVPQGLGRTDYPHLSYIVPLTMAAGAWIWGSGWARFFFLLLSVLPWFTARSSFADWSTLQNFWRNRGASAFMASDEKAAADYVQSHSAPGEAIFVGCSSHERLLFSPPGPYYWGHRPGATRFMQLDPGLATGSYGQAAMVRDLERSKPSLVLRFPGCWWLEANLSERFGATALDEYLAAHYEPTDAVGPFSVWTPRRPQVTSGAQ